MAIIFEVIYENNRPVLKRIEEIYGIINIPLQHESEKPIAEYSDYDPILDDPELRELDYLMRQIPRAGGK